MRFRGAWEINLQHETSCSKNGPLLDILGKLPFQVHVSTCLLGMSTPVLEALAPTQGHLGHQSCSASVLSQFPELSSVQLPKPDIWASSLTYLSFSPAPTPNPNEQGFCGSKTGAQVFAAALVIRDKMCRQPAYPWMGEMDKPDVVHWQWHTIEQKKEGAVETSCHVDEPQKHAKWKKSDPEDNLAYVSTYLKS